MSEQPFDVGRGQIAVVLLQEERVARLGRIGLAGIERDQQTLGIAPRVLASAIGAQIHLRKADPGGSSKAIGVLGQERPQLGLGRLCLRCDILADELHLQAQLATDHGVVAIETERECLAIEDLLLEVVLDQAVQLRRGRRPAPRSLEHLGQVPDLRLGDHDPIGPLVGQLPDHAVQDEQTRAQHQEMQQRLAQDLLQSGHRTPQPAGVYQIGEV